MSADAGGVPASDVGLGAASVGWRVRFAEERQAYTVQARGPRYLVCNKPFNARRTTLYTVVDLEKQIRGTENLVFPLGAETREQCEQMRDRLEGIDNHMMATEVSYRNNVPLRVVAVFSAQRCR